jgi:hypothetical protein
VKILLAFLLGTFFVSIWSTRRGGPMRAWPLLIVSVVVGAAYLSQRAL